MSGGDHTAHVEVNQLPGMFAPVPEKSWCAADGQPWPCDAVSGGDHNPGSELDLDAVTKDASLLDARGLMWGQLMCVLTDNQANTLGAHVEDLVAEVRRLRARDDDMREERGHIWTDPDDGTQVVWDRNPPKSAPLHRRLVTQWEPVEP